MRIAIIHNGVVENLIEADADYDPGKGVLAVATDTAGPGWSYDGKNFQAPAPTPPPVPTSVTAFQVREVLRLTLMPDGMTVLAAVEAFVEERRLSNPTLASAWAWIDPWERDGTYVKAFAGKFGFDDAALDDLFRRASEIVE